MDQSTLNLLIGGGIGFISAVLAQVISNHYQQKNAQIKHDWDIADKEKQEKNRIKLSRIDQIENSIVSTYASCSEYLSIFLNFDFSEKSIAEVVNRLTLAANNRNYMIAMAEILYDEILIKEMNEFSKLVEEYSALVVMYLRSKIQEEQKEILKLMGAKFSAMKVPFIRIVSHLDDIRIEKIADQ
jgi:hypothetical protein